MSWKRSRAHPKYKTKYRVTNWASYDGSLVRRGDVTLWFSPEAIDAWTAGPTGCRGAQPRFSDMAIETALTLRLVFHLPLRQTEGFLRSIPYLMGLDLEAPDHTTLSRRGRCLLIDLRARPTGDSLHLVVDSSGLTAFGDTTCPCSEKPMVRIGEETSEQLDYHPASLRVIQTVRAKYACGSCKEGVVVAPAPTGPIPRGKATAGTLAHVAVSKYADHLPLNRQVWILGRQGVELSKQTLCGWIRQVSELLAPIERAMWESVLRSRVLRADETPVKVLAKEKCHRGYLWAYVGDRSEVVFDFSMGRGSEVPMRALKAYQSGVLLTDAYAGYNRFVRAFIHILRAACWAHARRYFFEAKEHDPERALPILGLIGKLYDIEREVTNATASPAERAPLAYLRRQEQSKELVARIHARLLQDQDRILPKSPLGRAIRYTLGQWTELTRFLDDGEIPIDNNAAERELRAVAVGRNYADSGVMRTRPRAGHAECPCHVEDASMMSA